LDAVAGVWGAAIFRSSGFVNLNGIEPMTRDDFRGAHPGGRRRASFAFALCALAMSSTLEAQSLRGSSASLDLQNRIAREHDFTYLGTPDQVRSFVSLGYLVPVRANRDFDLHQVSFPYARPEAAIFIERLASQYRQACGQKLVVTSLTRPMSNQPANASPRSVHPTGMAIDLRISTDQRCRNWLENTLLQLEATGVLDVTRENRPPHYHVALFPTQYVTYVAALEARFAESVASFAAEEEGETEGEEGAVDFAQYRVRRGDTLWTIAQRLGTTVEEIRQHNELSTSRIYVGQVIVVPGL